MGKSGKKRARRESAVGGLEVVDDDDANRSASGKSTRGPPVATTSGRLSGSVPNDEWQTLQKSWAAIAHHFAAFRDKRIWMPFYYDGKCALHLRSLGFRNVVHTDEPIRWRVATLYGTSWRGEH